MGLDVHSCAIVGVEVERQRVTIPVTKYNENTGEPYQTTKTERVYKIVGTDIIIERPDNYVTYDMDEGWFLGIEIGRTNSHRNSEKQWFIVPDNYIDIVNQVQAMLTELGCDLTPKLFVYQNYSY